MSKDIYNLQIPITKELESQLRELAKLDERTIRVFCRRILQNQGNSCLIINISTVRNI